MLLTSKLSFDAGKADVVVTILQDRDGYEICMVEVSRCHLLLPNLLVVIYVHVIMRAHAGYVWFGYACDPLFSLRVCV